jgi:hypothetical protein
MGDFETLDTIKLSMSAFGISGVVSIARHALESVVECILVGGPRMSVRQLS